MPIPLQKIREIVLQLLYSYDIAQSRDQETSTFLSHELSISKKTTDEAFKKVLRIWETLDFLDQSIREMSIGYALERIQRIEINILRLGVYELVYDDAIPPKVAIAEAIRLARKYSTPEAATFVNALLDGIFKKREGVEKEPSIEGPQV